MSQEFFPKKSDATPTIYAYELLNDNSRKGQLKVGDTNRTAHQRIKEQTERLIEEDYLDEHKKYSV